MPCRSMRESMLISPARNRRSVARSNMPSSFGIGRHGFRQQDVITSAALHRTGLIFGILAETPEEIAAPRPLYRAAGILCHDQPLQGSALAVRGIEPYGHAQRNE